MHLTAWPVALTPPTNHAEASVLLLATDWVASTAIDDAFVIAQALLVAVTADVQYVALRRRA